MSTIRGEVQGFDTPIGTVTFLDGMTVLGTATLDANGNATFTTSDLALGSHDIIAVYSGDSTYVGSTATLTQTVSRLGTTISVTSSANSSLADLPATFMVTVSPPYGYSGTPTGTVTFLDGTTVLGTRALDADGNAYFSPNLPLYLGSQDIIAVYSGDGTYDGSSSSLTQLVDYCQTTTSLSSSADSSQVGQPVTFTATVTPASQTPAGTVDFTGTVDFYDGTTLLGSGTLMWVNGQWQATFTTSGLAVGSHDIVAVYSGDGTFADSESSLEETIDD